MAVASHLGIRLGDYDRQIRTFIPYYTEILDRTAASVAIALGNKRHPTIVDLGVGTGALARRCLGAVPGAAVIGIDADPGMLAMATRRLARRQRSFTFVCADFGRIRLPRADAFVATFALHHIARTPSKVSFYKRCFTALSDGGVVVSGDCHPSGVESLAAAQKRAWVAHLARWYGETQARRYLTAWAKDDTYVPLEQETDLMRRAGFRVDVAWRRGAFAVLLAAKA